MIEAQSIDEIIQESRIKVSLGGVTNVETLWETAVAVTRKVNWTVICDSTEFVNWTNPWEPSTDESKERPLGRKQSEESESSNFWYLSED